MSLPATITRGATVLTFSFPPLVLARQKDRGPARSVAGPTFAGTMIVEEWTTSADERYLRLYATLTDAQMTTLRTLLNGAGVVSVNLGSGTAITAMFGADKDHAIEPLMGDFPEVFIGGIAVPADRKLWKVTVTLVRV